METAWPSGAPIGPPPPREPRPVRPSDVVLGRRVAWASPHGLVRDMWIVDGPKQGRVLDHPDARPHEWYVGLIGDEVWWDLQAALSAGEAPKVELVEWTPVHTVWLD